MYIAQKIRLIRERTKLSQSRFGKKVGLSGKTISAYETGRSIPPLKVLDSISSAYNESILNIPSSQKTFLEEKIKLLEDSLREIKNVLDDGLSL